MASAAEQLAANINWSAFAKADELKKRIWFTLGALVVYRLGTYIPMPGINPDAYAAAVQRRRARASSACSTCSPAARSAGMAIFALAIMPYISASIIIQLLTSVSPQLEALKKEGEAGRKILNQYTRYLTVVLATLQAWGIARRPRGRPEHRRRSRACSSASRRRSRWSAARCSCCGSASRSPRAASATARR